MKVICEMLHSNCQIIDKEKEKLVLADIECLIKKIGQRIEQKQSDIHGCE